MRNLHNIEKSAFMRGEYVGYANGRVYRIRKTSAKSYTSWTATKQNEVPGEKLSDNYSLSGTTLAILSTKLEQLPNPYAKKVNDGSHDHAKDCARRIVPAAECTCYVSRLPQK